GARALQRLKESVRAVLGAFEHQVLEEVREPGLARPLVLRSDVIPEVDGDDRTGVVFMKHHIGPVGERVLREGAAHGWKLPQVSIWLPKYGFRIAPSFCSHGLRTIGQY